MTSREKFEKEKCQECKGDKKHECLGDSYNECICYIAYLEKQRKEEQGKVIEYINKKCKGCVGIKVNAKKDCTGCNIKGLSKAINKIYGGGE